MLDITLRVIRSAERAFDAEAWRKLAERRDIPDRELIDDYRARRATTLLQ